MALIQFNDEKSFYMDNRLSEDLDYIKNCIATQSRDYVLLIDGEEGDGKSCMAQQVACKVDPSFSVDRMCFSPKEFVEKVDQATKNQAIVFDEAFLGLSSRASMSLDNKLIVNTLMRVRSKCLFIIIVIPTIFMLDKYATLWRAKGLINVRCDRTGKRGYWLLFNRKALRMLYELGKKKFSYAKPRSTYHGKFYNKWMINVKAYDKKKNDNLVISIEENPRKFLFQRNILFTMLTKQVGVTEQQISDYLFDYDVKITRQAVNKAIKSIK